jgi:MYXO-CTERM domain-containing protein
MVDIRTYCHAARLAAFSCPQKHWNALIFRGALKHFSKGFFAGLAFVYSFWPVTSKAGVVYNLYQQGVDVVLEATGSFATLPSSVGTLGPCNTGIYPNIAATCTGVFGPDQKVYNLMSGGLTSWSPIGYTAASSSTGNPLSINATSGQIQFDKNYVLNAPIFSSALFSTKLLVDLGITSFGILGTYTLDGTSETITVQASPAPPTVPGPLPLVGVGAAFGMSRRLRQRIQLGRPRIKR